MRNRQRSEQTVRSDCSVCSSDLSFQYKVVSVKGEDPLISHPSQLCGHRAPVHGEEVRELLPVKRNIEHRTSGPLGLLRQIGQKLFPRRSSGHMLQFPGEHFILFAQAQPEDCGSAAVELTG